MKKKRALAASRLPVDYHADGTGPVYTIRDPEAQPNSIILNTGHDDSEMLRITRDGFYVRGVRVPADEKEAQLVYDAFKEFLVYHNLARQY